MEGAPRERVDLAIALLGKIYKVGDKSRRIVQAGGINVGAFLTADLVEEYRLFGKPELLAELLVLIDYKLKLNNRRKQIREFFAKIFSKKKG